MLSSHFNFCLVIWHTTMEACVWLYTFMWWFGRAFMIPLALHWGFNLHHVYTTVKFHSFSLFLFIRFSICVAPPTQRKYLRVCVQLCTFMWRFGRVFCSQCVYGQQTLASVMMPYLCATLISPVASFPGSSVIVRIVHTSDLSAKGNTTSVCTLLYCHVVIWENILPLVCV